MFHPQFQQQEADPVESPKQEGHDVQSARESKYSARAQSAENHALLQNGRENADAKGDTLEALHFARINAPTRHDESSSYGDAP